MLIKKKQLGILLSKIAPIPKPRLKWEGYTLDAESAAEIAYLASLNNDIRHKSVVDLGCGSGILAIAASLLGAEMVVGVDIDKEAIETAKVNAERVSAQVNLVASDIDCIVGHFDTALMNPPFGAWRRGADIHFLEKALEISDVVYSLHKRSKSVREFLRFTVPQIGGQIDKVYEIDIAIRRTYSFHRKDRYIVKTDLYRVLRKAH
jgi:putative methylase